MEFSFVFLVSKGQPFSQELRRLSKESPPRLVLLQVVVGGPLGLPHVVVSRRGPPEVLVAFAVPVSKGLGPDEEVLVPLI